MAFRGNGAAERRTASTSSLSLHDLEQGFAEGERRRETSGETSSPPGQSGRAPRSDIGEHACLCTGQTRRQSAAEAAP